MRKLVVVLSLLILLGCTQEVDVQLEPEVSLYFSNDRSKSVRLTATDKEYVALNEWLRANRSGWQATSGRFPGGVYIKSGRYGIQVTKVNVVLYAADRGEPKAIYVQVLGRGELTSLKEMDK